MATKKECSLSCRSGDTSSLRRPVAFNIQGRSEAAGHTPLYDLHHRRATQLLVANVVQTRKRLNEITCARSCAGGRVIGRVGSEKSKKPQYYCASNRVKRRLDTVGVCGSNPHAPTNLSQLREHRIPSVQFYDVSYDAVV